MTRTKAQAIEIIHSRIKTEQENQKERPDIYGDFSHGFVRGLETALYFLGEPDAVKKHNEAMKRIMGEDWGKAGGGE